MTKMQSELSMKDGEMKESKLSLQKTNDDTQQSLLAAKELAKKLRDESDNLMRAVNAKQRLIDEVLQEKVVNKFNLTDFVVPLLHVWRKVLEIVGGFNKTNHFYM